VITFEKYCRYNSGRAMCDSGDAYGRHWQRPPIPEDAPMIREWDKGCSATIETSKFLDKCLRIDEEIHKQFDEWVESLGKDDRTSWFELAETFMSEHVKDFVWEDDPEQRPRHRFARDNVYNGENDLSQVYVWEAWGPESAKDREWFYSKDEYVTVIFIHTGCDVRGGYSPPIFCRSKIDYQVPMDLCAEYCVAESRPEQDDNERLDEHWQAGYSSFPYGQLEDDVERWFEFTRTRNSVCVKLKTGEVVKVMADVPYMGE